MAIIFGCGVSRVVYFVVAAELSRLSRLFGASDSSLQLQARFAPCRGYNPAVNQPSNADPDATPTVAGGERTGAVFATTHWSVVLAAGQQHSPLAQEALARLCETYRSPLLAYAQAL
ncbi:MAG: hypothetical protein HY674_11015, partial [Chloroflexi bacterium]|nr:hypothetical protein [Chloroflexota bacterium]